MTSPNAAERCATCNNPRKKPYAPVGARSGMWRHDENQNHPFAPAPPTVAERCHAGKDGDCIWTDCPQLRDSEPIATGRACPLWDVERDYAEEH